MKTNLAQSLLKTVAFLLLLSTLNSQLSTLAQGTAFTYQGRLNQNASPANGAYDLQFSLYDAASNGNAIGGPVTNAATSVTNGLFVAVLDFGPAMFAGADRWLEIGVRTNGSSDPFATLSPRQSITPTPYAIFSSSSGSISNGLIQNPLFIGTTGGTPLELFAGESARSAPGAEYQWCAKCDRRFVRKPDRSWRDRFGYWRRRCSGLFRLHLFEPSFRHL